MSTNDDLNPDGPDTSDLVITCPICGGRMETVYHRHHQRVVVCVDCHAGLTVPTTAWELARLKRGL